MARKIIPISPSTLGTMKTCPRQFEAKYITREVQFVQSPQAAYGDKVHKAMEQRILYKTPMPAGMENVEPFVNRFESYGGKLMAETSLSIDKNNNGCAWYERFIGARADVCVLHEDRIFIGDLKTGKVRADMTQLQLLIKCAFGMFPNIERATAALFYPHENHVDGIQYTRDRFNVPELDMEIKRYVERQEMSDYMPNPSGLCKEWCDVISCEYNGKRNQ